MKRITAFISILLFGIPLAFSQVILQEGFESGLLPDGWTNERVIGTVDWKYQDGGYNPSGLPNGGSPPAAYSGSYNALMHYSSASTRKTRLVTEPIDLEFAIKPELRFWHAQVERNVGSWVHDELKIYMKHSIDSAWVLLAEYPDTIQDWEQHIVLLPDSLFSDSSYIAFEGITNNGFGVCLDDVEVIETGTQSRVLDSINISHPNLNFVPSGSKDIPVLRILFRVKGNTGNLPLNSLEINSLNTDDNDIDINGVKLYHGTSTVFYQATQLGSATSFSGGKATFSSLSHNLPTGYSYLWVTYDVKSNAGHDNMLDASVLTHALNINGSTYPATDESPTGSKAVYESVFYDDFEGTSTWTLSGDFQINTPDSLGGVVGKPDPHYVPSGTNVLGNDLTGLGTNTGDYEANVGWYGNIALSDTFNLHYYKDVKISFLRWLNIDLVDTTTIEMSKDNGQNWEIVWQNHASYTENRWNFVSHDLTSARRADSLSIRFNLGPTDNLWNYSGWNIDNFAITGNYIEYDVGPTELIAPVDGCGHTSADDVTIKVKNFGPGATPDKIPVRYSFNGGLSFSYDTINQVIAFDGETTFTFAPKVDLSAPGYYNVVIGTTLGVDEDDTNNTLDTTIFVAPSYTVPYDQNFESDEDYWRGMGTNNSWEYGTPAGSVINSAASGTKAWVTRLNENYNADELSYLESPCFDFTRVENPVFECKLIRYLESNVDGVTLEYSLNNGDSWTRVGNMGDGDAYQWNWYNSNTISALGQDGWTGNDFQWKISRVFLPPAVEDQPNVKFRFVFASDGANEYEGIGIDDIQIYDAPRDIGVISVDQPVSACGQDIADHVVVTLQNFGLDTLMTGDTIIVGYDYESNPSVVDTFQLVSNVLAGGTFQYTFPNLFQVYSSGTKDISGFTLLPDDNNFYNQPATNDTTATTFNVLPTPFTDLPRYLYTVLPDTVVLDATPIDPFGTETYLWMDATNTAQYTVTLKETKQYSVWVDNGGCTFRDTTDIIWLIADAGVTEIISPESDCELGSSVRPEIRFRNFGTDTLQIGDTLRVGYQVGANPAIEEVITLTDMLYPDSVMTYTFTGASDMSAVQTYSIDAYTKLAYDETTGNDHTVKAVDVYGITNIDLGSNIVERALNYTIDAGAGYDWYLWQDASANQTLIVDTTGWYKVTVQQGTYCQNSDSVHVTLIIPDIEIDRIYAPGNSCSLTSTESVDLYVKNVGTDTLWTNDTIAFAYTFEGGALTHDTLFVASNVLPGDSVRFTFTQTFNMLGENTYSFDITANYDKDLVPANNQFVEDITVYGYPSVNLGPDVTSNTKIYQLDAGAGYASYLWQDGSTNQTFDASYQDAGNTYTVTVANEFGCEDSDDIIITFIIPDIGISNILEPRSSCSLTSVEDLVVRVRNLGSVTLLNEEIEVGAIVDGGPEVIESILIIQAFEHNEYINHTFGQKFDFSAKGQHNIKVFTRYSNDADATNDTLNLYIDHLEGTTVDLGGVNDTLRSNLPATLDAGSGFVSYVWNGVTGSQRYNAASIGWYRVVVTDINECTAEDSVYVTTPDAIWNIRRIDGEVAVYPNPANDFVKIEVSVNTPADFYIELINEGGQIMLSKKYPFTDRLYESLDITRFTRGIYHLRIHTKDQQEIRKIVIQ